MTYLQVRLPDTAPQLFALFLFDSIFTHLNDVLQEF